MTKPEIKNKIVTNHQNFIAIIENLTEEEFLLSINEKWSAGQQLDHIYRSVKPPGSSFRLT